MALTRIRATNILDSDYKNSCRLSSASDVTLSGGAPLTVDNKTVAVGDRILVRGQAASAQNGIYRVTDAGTGSNGTWVRDTDASATNSISPGLTVYVEEGDLYADTFWYCSNTGTITIGVTGITFTSLTAAVGATTPGGYNQSIQFNDSGIFGGATYLQYNKSNGNLVSNSTTTSTSTTTGALVAPSAGISGNLYVGNIVTTSGIFYPNGATAGGSGVVYTAASSPPSGPKNGDQWYNTSTDTLYEYATDGATSFWIDIQSPIITATGNNMAATYSTITVNGVTLSNGNIWANSGTSSASTTTGAVTVRGGIGASGNLFVGGLANISYSGSVESALSIVGADTKGGAGYHDFLKVTNTGGTNPNKYLRLNPTGGMEIISSNYGTNLFTLDDTGNVSIGGSLTMTNRPACRVYGVNSYAWSSTISGVAVDYNQGSYYNNNTGQFTAPFTGLYQVYFNARAGATASLSQAGVFKNGQTSSGNVAVFWEISTNATQTTHFGESSIVKLNAGDYLVAKCITGTINFDANDNWGVAYIG